MTSKLQFIGKSPPPRAKPIKSFGQAFSKACADPTREYRTGGAVSYPPTLCVFGRPPQRAKYLIVRKRHRRVNFKSCKLLKEGGPVVGVLRQRRSVRTAQVGGSPFCTKAILFLYPLFSLTHEAQDLRRADKLNLNQFAEPAPCRAGSPSHVVILKSLAKKKRREKFRRVRAATNAPRVGSAVAF